MSNNKTITGEFDLHRPFDDLALRFADRPIYRISFEMEPDTIALMARRFADRVYRSSRMARHDGLHWMSMVLRFDDETFVFMQAHRLMRGEVCASDPGRAEAVYRELAPVFNELASVVKRVFYMLRHDGCDISTEEITDLPTIVPDDMLPLYYGEDILDWMTRFETGTRDRTGGITILEGAPGTGKTTLVSQLVVRLAASHVFYVLPVGNEGALTSPELVPFWVEQNRVFPDKIKVIVMEDAERVLLRRSSDNQDAVSSMLNIADGLMGRMLRVHLMCSLNGKLEEIDPAILRPGRLSSHRHFGLIPRDRAMAIAASRGVVFDPNNDRDRFTLAEILNPTVTPPTKRSCEIGF
jgi:hypothetical protein